MAAKKILRLVNNVITEVFGVQASAGAANAGDIVALDDTGRIDQSMLPVGIGADTAQVEASEDLNAGDFVNVYSDGGVAKVRKADATVAGKTAVGFVLTGAAEGTEATVYFEGTNTQVTGQIAGEVFLQTTAGQAGGAAPASAGNVVQKLGVALSATEINFEKGTPVVLA